jgi:RimJ/RimL family protein N-acetyltransferase
VFPSGGHVVEVIHTELELRPLGFDDALALTAIRTRGSEQSESSRLCNPIRTENVSAGAQRQASASGEVREFGLWKASSSTLMGSIEVQRVDRYRANLSYFVSPPFRRRGVATHAALLALSYASSHGAAAVTIKALTTNVASIGVARAIGAREVGLERNEAGWMLRVFELRL